MGDKKIPIKLVIVDNESDPNKAGSLAESLIVQDKVNFIVSGDEPPPMHPGVSQAAEKHKVVYITSTGPEEPWAAMRQETPTKWQYTWATGLFAIVSPAAAGDFREQTGVYDHGHVDGHARSLRRQDQQEGGHHLLRTTLTGGAGTRCSDRP